MNAIVIRQTIDLIIDVDRDAWQAAKMLEEAGLEVDTVLPLTRVVMGVCVDSIKSKIEECECVVNCEEDDNG